MLNENFNKELPLSPLHWMISDRDSSIVVESVKAGLNVYPNPVGVLTNNATFVKASFIKMNSVCDDSESESVSQFFHILGSVEHPRGCVAIKEDLYEITLYSCCCNTDKGIYYYRTYDNSQITAVGMYRENLDNNQMICYPLIAKQQIKWQN